MRIARISSSRIIRTGPTWTARRAEIVDEISKLAGVDISSAFRSKGVDQAMRWHARYYRQNGAHTSPTFAINGLIEPNMSSGQSVAEWVDLLQPHFAAA